MLYMSGLKTLSNVCYSHYSKVFCVRKGNSAKIHFVYRRYNKIFKDNLRGLFLAENNQSENLKLYLL